MKVQLHNGLQQPQTIDATRVVVLDKYDNPIAVAMETEDGVIIAETASPANIVEFNNILRALGINKTVIVHDAQQKPLNEIQIPNA